MMTITHLTSGALVGCLIGSGEPVSITTAAIMALLPDIDHSLSPAGRCANLLSQAFTGGRFKLSNYLESQHKHRGLTHSITVTIGILVFCLIFQWLGILTSKIAYAIAGGYFFGGILPDCFTKTGARLLYPFTMRPCWCPDNQKYRLSTGSNVELLILVLLALALTISINLSTGGGVGVAFADLIGTPEAIEQVYRVYGNDRRILLEVKGWKGANRTPVNAVFQLIQPDGSSWIVKDDKNRILRIGNSNGDNIIAERIKAKAEKPINSKIEVITLNDESVSDAIAKFYNANSNSEIYLTGAISIDSPDLVTLKAEPDTLQTITISGNSATFTAANAVQAYQTMIEQWGTGSINALIHSEL